LDVGEAILSAPTETLRSVRKELTRELRKRRPRYGVSRDTLDLIDAEIFRRNQKKGK